MINVIYDFMLSKYIYIIYVLFYLYIFNFMLSLFFPLIIKSKIIRVSRLRAQRI